MNCNSDIIKCVNLRKNKIKIRIEFEDLDILENIKSIKFIFKYY